MFKALDRVVSSIYYSKSYNPVENALETLDFIKVGGVAFGAFAYLSSTLTLNSILIAGGIVLGSTFAQKWLENKFAELDENQQLYGATMMNSEPSENAAEIANGCFRRIYPSHLEELGALGYNCIKERFDELIKSYKDQQFPGFGTERFRDIPNNAVGIDQMLHFEDSFVDKPPYNVPPAERIKRIVPGELKYLIRPSKSGTLHPISCTLVHRNREISTGEGFTVPRAREAATRLFLQDTLPKIHFPRLRFINSLHHTLFEQYNKALEDHTHIVPDLRRLIVSYLTKLNDSLNLQSMIEKASQEEQDRQAYASG